MIWSFLLNPLLWLTLIVVGHCTTEHWLFWAGLALAGLFVLFTRLAMKALGKGIVAQAKAMRARR